MSTCLSSRACGFDLEHMIKWPCSTNSSRTTSNSSSPSSTLSESSNSPIAISTRKPRKPRKRPNQTYSEAAALLSMACPNIFSTKHLIKKPTNLPKFTKPQTHFFNQPPELIENSKYHQITEKPSSLTESKITTLCQNTGEIESNCVCVELGNDCLDDFDTESILDEEIEQGIDSIMGESNSVTENKESNDKSSYGYPIGLGFRVRNGVRALKNCDDRNWWCFPMVDVSPAVTGKCEKSPVGKKKKKKVEELMKLELGFNSGGIEKLNNNRIGKEKRLVLKLDYDDVLNDWSDKGSPVPEEIWHNAPTGGDIYARAANIDLFSDNGGWSESSAKRSIDKNYSKKNRHHVKIPSSDRRTRCKGRFVKKTISTACDDET